MLEILDEAGGTLYLRGSALGRYDGAAWRAPEDEPPTQAGGIAQATAAAAAAQGQARQIEIRHLSGETQLAYVPYYAVAGEGEIGESYARPLERTDAYGWTYVPLESARRRGGGRGGAALPRVGAGGVHRAAGGPARAVCA